MPGTAYTTTVPPDGKKHPPCQSRNQSHERDCQVQQLIASIQTCKRPRLRGPSCGTGLMEEILQHLIGNPLFPRFHTSQVVRDFSHQQNVLPSISECQNGGRSDLQDLAGVLEQSSLGMKTYENP